MVPRCAIGPEALVTALKLFLAEENGALTQPAFLTIKTVACLKTEDSIGEDDLFGVIGIDRFVIGHFQDDTTQDVGINRAIPSGAVELTIVETDIVGPDDVLITIDLTQDMDVERIVGVLTGRARYNLTFQVTSG